MPSSAHEALVEIFRTRPVLVAEVLAGALGVDLPGFAVARRLRVEGAARGRAQTKAEAVQRVLHVRGVDVPEHDRVRITACTDLDSWLERAVTAESIDDLDR